MLLNGVLAHSSDIEENLVTTIYITLVNSIFLDESLEMAEAIELVGVGFVFISAKSLQQLQLVSTNQAILLTATRRVLALGYFGVLLVGSHYDFTSLVCSFC